MLLTFIFMYNECFITIQYYIITFILCKVEFYNIQLIQILEILFLTCPCLMGALDKVLLESLLLYIKSNPCPSCIKKEAERQSQDNYRKAVFSCTPIVYARTLHYNILVLISKNNQVHTKQLHFIYIFTRRQLAHRQT